METVTKTIRLNILEPTTIKLDRLNALSTEYLRACNFFLDVLKSNNVRSKYTLQHLYYSDIKRSTNLQAQLIVDACKDVWIQRGKIEKIKKFKRMPIRFNVPRSGSFSETERGNPVVSVATLNKKRVAIPIRQDGAYDRFTAFREEGYDFAQFTLQQRDGNWTVLVTLKKDFVVPNPKPTQKVLGVDIGTNVLATISVYNPIKKTILKQLYLGKDVSQTKRNIGIRRSKLQEKRKISWKARRALGKLRGYETRFTKTRCFEIAHQIVNIAKKYNATIAIEDLKHLNRAKLGRRNNRKVKRMPYFIFRQALESVAWQNGVSVTAVSPRDTSKTCSRCGIKGSVNGRTFKCRCGFIVNRDRNASVNIAQRAVYSFNPETISDQNSLGWVAVNQPARHNDSVVECLQHSNLPMNASS